MLRLQGVAHGLQQRTGPGQHQRPPALGDVQTGDLGRDPGRLVLVGLEHAASNRLVVEGTTAGCRFCGALRVGAPGVVDHETIRGLDDARRAAEVGRKLHHLAIEVLDQGADPTDVGAVPFVDRLVVVSHGEDSAEVFARHTSKERVLGSVGVLELVDEPVAVDGLIVSRYGRIAEESVRLEDERVEVQSVGAVQLLFVEVVGARQAAGLIRRRTAPTG